MSEEKDGEKKFKVEDRRTSRGGKDESGGKTAGEDSAKESPEAPEEKQLDDRKSSAPGDRAPKLDFSTFIFSLFSSALIQLGEMPDPINGKQEQNLEAAKQTIDILDILKDKTKGNLEEEERKFFENASAELKWKYLNAVKEKG
ncbi:MAG: DUF1844 domain-containing protein [Deltaproteobacteria bacterium]|nr:DUF1844 domain-containing protein [Deltaproteobacteria bacterium]